MFHIHGRSSKRQLRSIQMLEASTFITPWTATKSGKGTNTEILKIGLQLLSESTVKSCLSITTMSRSLKQDLFVESSFSGLVLICFGLCIKVL